MRHTYHSVCQAVGSSGCGRTAPRQAPPAGAVEEHSALAAKGRRRGGPPPIGCFTPRRTTRLPWKYLLSILALIAMTSLSHARMIANDDGGLPDIPEQSGALDPTSPAIDPDGPAGVVGGIIEPDYQYPWVVRNDGAGCWGVLIEPRWVLTAAHCATPNLSQNTWRYSRTDPDTGLVHQDSRGPAEVGLRPNPGAYLHPLFNPNILAPEHDIALIRLAEPFAIDRFLQTVGVPTTPRHANVVGAYAGFSHTMELPPGQVAVFRAPIPPDTVVPPYPYDFFITTTEASGAGCPGDSGAGFVTYENGRATVRGIVSAGSRSDCTTPAGQEVLFMDVFGHRDWILETMRTVEYRLAGTTRVRREGPATRGVMGLGCINPYGTLWGPLDVLGVELGANCEPVQTQTVVCALDDTGPHSPVLRTVINGFTMTTTCAPYGTIVESLPFTEDLALYFGPTPASPDPIGLCTREFTCKLGIGRDYILDNSGGVLAQ